MLIRPLNIMIGKLYECDTFTQAISACQMLLNLVSDKRRNYLHYMILPCVSLYLVNRESLYTLLYRTFLDTGVTVKVS